MKCQVFVAVIAVAAAFNAPAKDPTPEELGMLDSPEAFVLGCGPVFDPNSELYKGQPTTAKADSKAGYKLAATMVMGVACAGIIRSVAETVTFANPYTYVKTGKRICVSQEVSVKEIFEESKEIFDADPNGFKGEHPTSNLILQALVAKSDCKANK